MPRAYDDKEAVPPGDHTVRVASVLHVGSRHKLPSGLVQDARSLQVGLCARNGTTSHINSTLHLDALLIPQVQVDLLGSLLGLIQINIVIVLL